MTRILAVMGSGETTPTMTKHHRRLLDAAGPGHRVLLDSPYGFQENADDITGRALDYFRVSLVAEVEAVSLRSPDADARNVAGALDAARRASWLFTGPGSPTYAMRVWSTVGLAPVVAGRLAPGASGVTIFSSAAALTLGRWCVPVYEVYKVGADPYWAGGLDVFHEATGFDAVVIPHFDNAEGGNHDTRFCYLGERRLSTMERDLPDATWVLGVDEHTAALFDLDARTVDVVGRGALTVRVRGSSVRFEAGSTVGFDALLDAAAGRMGASAMVVPAAAGVAPHGPMPPAVATGAGADDSGSLTDTASACEALFDTAIDATDLGAAVDAALRLEQDLEAWKGDTSTTDERDRARAALHRMIVRLGTLAVDGSRDPAELLGPVIRIVLEQRTLARASRDFARSDAIRDALAGAGIEVRDTHDGQEWTLVHHEPSNDPRGRLP